ncbi:hypothetical protein B0H13DRAFT_1514018, partial [Mycena leptocephala]
SALSNILQIQIVDVGGANGAPVYRPNTITAPNGTIVVFRFSGTPGNHTVTQSSLRSPCEPLPNGFDSGWVFVDNSDPNAQPPEWHLYIEDDRTPITFYCKQLNPTGPKPHCEEGAL